MDIQNKLPVDDTSACCQILLCTGSMCQGRQYISERPILAIYAALSLGGAIRSLEACRPKDWESPWRGRRLWLRTWERKKNREVSRGCPIALAYFYCRGHTSESDLGAFGTINISRNTSTTVEQKRREHFIRNL